MNMNLNSVQDDFRLNAEQFSMNLSAVQDDFKLNALFDTDRANQQTFSFAAYFIDPSGNYLVDPNGNRLVGYYTSVVSPQKLNALKDDFNLNAG